jgi:hypothetical protein
MPFSDLLKYLVIDSWYKLLVYVGFILFVISQIYKLQTTITSAQLMLLSGGLFLVGLGEWLFRSHRLVSYAPNAYIAPKGMLVKEELRKPNIIGMLLQLVGISLIGIFIYSIVIQVI